MATTHAQRQLQKRGDQTTQEQVGEEVGEEVGKLLATNHPQRVKLPETSGQAELLGKIAQRVLEMGEEVKEKVEQEVATCLWQWDK